MLQSITFYLNILSHKSWGDKKLEHEWRRRKALFGLGEEKHNTTLKCTLKKPSEVMGVNKQKIFAVEYIRKGLSRLLFEVESNYL